MRTANDTSLSIESVALIDFALKPNTEKIKVPFSSPVNQWKILFSDIILISDTSSNDPKMFDTLMSAFPHITSEEAETVAPIIKKVTEVPGLLGDMKVIKRTIIPSKSELFSSF